MAEKLEAELKSLTKRREYEFSCMQILLDLSKLALTNKSKLSSFRARYKSVDQIKQDFLEVNDRINKIEVTLNPESSINNQTLLAFDELYFSVVEFADSLVVKSESATGSPVTEKSRSSPQIKLPKIQIPKFDGNVENWQSFKDSYVPLIHSNATLSNAEKFHYLISCLSGFALTIAKGLPITAANYEIVYDSLLDRYDNKRVLATAYFDKIFNATPINKPSLETLTGLLNTLYENVNALQSLAIPNLSEFLLFYIASRALDSDTRRRFELQNESEIPTFDKLIKYLQGYIKILEVSQTTSVSPSTSTQKQVRNNNNNKSNKFTSQSKSTLVASTTKPQSNNNSTNKGEHKTLCPCCNYQHSIYRCQKLQSLNVHSRRQLVNDLKLCFNCLRSGHDAKGCNSNNNCLICSAKHNTLLHIDSQSTHESKSDNSSTALTSSAVVTAPSAIQSTKILGSAIVRVRRTDGSLQCARALIDSCSMDSFMTISCARRLGLPIRKCKMNVTGLGQSSVLDIKGVTFCSIMPRQSETPKFDLPFVVLPKITALMPSSSLPPPVRDHFSHLDLADDNFHRSSAVDLLLGVECFDQIYTGARYVPGPGLPCALASVFGWVISGQFLHHFIPKTAPNQFTSLLASTCQLDDIVKRFWETEEPPRPTISRPEDDICEQKYKDGTYRTPEGRYVVPIMLKDDAPSLGDSYRGSLNRFLTLEKRLSRDSELKSEYTDFMHQYEDLGHMQPAAASCSDARYIIPHHCVVRPESSTTRLRVVFDASSKTSTHKSLNDIVHVGPKLQIDIIDLVTKFRLHAIVFTADICKMYRQILIRPQDRSYQHIFWRDQPNDPLVEYELATVTYGVSSSPFLAIRTLRQLADDHGSQYSSRAGEVLREDTFMDDITTGCSSLNEAIQLKRDLISLLAQGQFELRKWSSNNPELLADIPPEHCQTPKTFDEGNQEFIKILGIQWDPSSDSFSYSFSENFDIKFTKRSILSITARIFDALGWISPLIFSAKLLLQDMWKLNLDWDEPIPHDLAKKWHIIAANLHDIQHIKLPRNVLPPNPTQIHLVGFCDGSSKGYGCCVYLCAVTPNSTVSRLLIGKSKVAPLKPTTVNRLELCAAVLLSRVLSHMYNVLKNKINIDSVRAYSDSTTTLAWLSTPPHLLKMFVANRVVQVTDVVDIKCWSHVSTADNPADCCSRGISCSELTNHPLWWSGPLWLSQHPSEWPSKLPTSSGNELPEIKPAVAFSLLTMVPENDLIDKLIYRHSSLTRLLRILAWLLRFSNNLKCNKEDRRYSSLSTTELDNSLMLLVKHSQRKYLQDELEKVTHHQTCSKPIQKLSPFLDRAGMLRVGGRIDNAGLPNSVLHPLLLPKACGLSRLIVEHFHAKYLHCGPRTLQSLVQRKFWIIGGRLLVRTVVSKCVQCFKVKPVPCQPEMGKLPASRLQPSRCFQTTGIDFGGPFILKESRRRNARTFKAYMCLFVCLSTKAIHLEAVTELSSEAFLAALDRMVSRRGICHTIITDCGTNFVGANRHMKNVMDELRNSYSDIADGLANRSIKWEFNPPSAPHFGGIFESGIKSTKYHFKRVVGSQVLTFEEMSTVLAKIEAILNSRPLCAISTDPNESDVLTPGHFLIGGPLCSLPETSMTDKTIPRSRWQLLQRLTQSFWRVWQRDYLHTLQQKNKWFKGTPNIKINDLVIVIEPTLPTLSWRLAKIEQLHPGRDNVVRVVTLRTANGNVFRRPVVKICPLPIDA